MIEHEQVETEVEWKGCKFTICVDKGLEEIIQNFFNWDMETCNSCINNNGDIWIQISEFYDLKKFLQSTLHHNTIINGKGYERDTLWNFIEENVEITVTHNEEVIFDPNNEDTVIGTGVLDLGFSLRFEKELLNDFKELFFDAFPPK